jgi:hypothetical protein
MQEGAQPPRLCVVVRALQGWAQHLRSLPQGRQRTLRLVPGV